MNLHMASSLTKTEIAALGKVIVQSGSTVNPCESVST